MADEPDQPTPGPADRDIQMQQLLVKAMKAVRDGKARIVVGPMNPKFPRKPTAT